MRNLKDKKIIIYKKIVGKDSAGFAIESYKPIHPGKLWAYVRQLSASEYYASMALQQKEEMFFTINWRNDINPKEHYILYKDMLYDITRIDTFEGYKDDLKVYAILYDSKPGALEEWQG